MKDNSQNEGTNSNSGTQNWPEPRQAWYALGLCTVALMFNFLDRGILTLLVEPIKRDMQLTDTQISLIIGFAFVSFYAVVGLPIARLVDSHSRRLILGTGIALWSGMTAVCGIAQNFWQLFAARLGVGVGEACNGPATFSLLSDLFPKEKLSKALSVLNIGFVFGQGIALIVGGTIVGMLSQLPEITLPVIGQMRAWQLTFFVVGIPGLIIAGLMATVIEPKRRGLIASSENARPKPEALPLKDIFKFLFDNRRAYAPMFLGLAVQGIMVIGIISWIPTFFIRHHHWTIAHFGQVLGLIFLLISPLGLLTGGFLSERFAKKGYDDANIRVLVISAVLVVPFIVLFPLVSNPYVSIALLAGQNFILAIAIGPQNAAFQVITPNQIRGQVTALFLFVFNIIGFGLGPTFIAVITDYVFGNEDQLGHAMSLAALIMEPLAAFIFWWGMKPYGESYVKAKAWS